MVGVSRKAGMRVIVFLVTITLGVFALAQADAQSDSSASLHRSTTTLVSPASASAGTYFDHVIIILMENQGVFDICRSSPPPCSTSGPAPYMAGLANNYTIGAQYLSLIETSQPNYVALISGSTQGCTSTDCPIIKAQNLVDRFEAAGLTWKGYMENQTLTAGCDLKDHEPYVTIHNPFLPFQDITNNTARCNKIVLANPPSCGSITDCALVNDLNNATTPAPNFMWLTPNDCDNTRGAAGICLSSITTGNNYLAKLVPVILNSRAFTTARSALFITYDEGNGFCPLNGSNEDCVYTVWAGPQAKTHFGTPNLYSHYSFPRTIEKNWGFGNFTVNDGNANSMAEFFKSTGPDYTVTASPALVTLPINVRSNSTIAIAGFNNYAGTVTLTVASSPAGPTLTLSPSTIILSINGTGSSTLSFISNAVGTYTVTVTGTSGILAHNATLVINVTPPPNFTISSPSSLVLGQGSFTSAPTTVTTTDDHSSFTYSYQRDSFYARGLIWLFYQDPRNTCEHQSGCLEFTTSTNGTRWSTPTTVPVHVADGDFSVYTDNSNIFYVRYNETSFESTCGQKLQFRTGTLNINGTVSWQPEQTVVTGASFQALPGEQIIVDSNGQAWIAYFIENKSGCGGSGTDRPQIIHSTGTNYAVWSGNTTLCVASCHSNIWHIGLASLGNGRVYASYWLTNRDLHGRLYNGTSWQAEEQISPTATTTDANAWLFNAGTSLYQIYYDNTTETFSLATRSSTGIWTTNLIGSGESHTGTIAFSPSYTSLPDAAGYDITNNRFYLFWMNATNHAIDQWTGLANTWTKTTGIISTGMVTYPDGITCFIQSPPTSIGAIFYTSSATSPFTINAVTTAFNSGNSTGRLVVTVTGQFGFTNTVNLAETISPTAGLTMNCSPTSIPTGTGSSTCNLSSSTPGNYTVTIAGTSGTLNHSTQTLVLVPVASPPDFALTAASPPATPVGQSTQSTITVTANNGFSGIVQLTDNVPTGLACTSIIPSGITGSGTASFSCSSNLSGNYTVLITATSGSLSHDASITFHVVDFNLAMTNTIISPIGSNTTTTIILSSLNGYSGNVSLTVTLQPAILGSSGGLGGGTRALFMAPPSSTPVPTITPAFLVLAPGSSGRSNLTITMSTSVQPGNYTITVTATYGLLTHVAQVTLTASDYGITASSGSLVIQAGSNSTQTLSLWSIYHFTGNIALTATISPTGPTSSLNPSMVSLASNTGTSNLTITVPSSTPAGNYTLTIVATSGTLTHTIFVEIRVTTGATSLLTRILGSNQLSAIDTLSIISGVCILSIWSRIRTRGKPGMTRKRPCMRTGAAYRIYDRNRSYNLVPGVPYIRYALTEHES